MLGKILFLIALAANASAQTETSNIVRMFHREQSVSYLEPSKRTCLMLDLKTGQLAISQSVQSYQDNFQDHLEERQGIVTQVELTAVAALVDGLNGALLAKMVAIPGFHNMRPIQEVALALPLSGGPFGYLEFQNVNLEKMNQSDRQRLAQWSVDKKALDPLVEKLRSVGRLANQPSLSPQEDLCQVLPSPVSPDPAP